MEIERYRSSLLGRRSSLSLSLCSSASRLALLALAESRSSDRLLRLNHLLLLGMNRNLTDNFCLLRLCWQRVQSLSLINNILAALPSLDFHLVVFLCLLHGLINLLVGLLPSLLLLRSCFSNLSLSRSPIRNELLPSQGYSLWLSRILGFATALLLSQTLLYRSLELQDLKPLDAMDHIGDSLVNALLFSLLAGIIDHGNVKRLITQGLRQS